MYNFFYSPEVYVSSANTPGCCVSYGLGSRMIPGSFQYSYTTRNNCVSPRGMVGGGKAFHPGVRCRKVRSYKSPYKQAKVNLYKIH